MANPLKYNAKEYNKTFNLNWLDYGWRNQDPQTGRWWCVDKLAEMYVSSSPYAYCGNDPINQIDIDGRSYKTYMQEHYGTSGFRGTSSFGSYGGDYDGGGMSGGGGGSIFPKMGMGLSESGQTGEQWDALVNAAQNKQDITQYLINGIMSSNIGLTWNSYTGVLWYSADLAVDKIPLGRFDIINGGCASVSDGGVGSAYDVFYGGFSFKRVCEFDNGLYSGNNIFAEAYWHYQFGNGDALNVSTSSLDLSGISMHTPEIQQIVKDGSGFINLFSYMKNQTGLAIGSVKFNYIGDNMFFLSPDRYDFDIRWREGNTARNRGTFFAGLLHGPVIDNIPILFGPSVYFGGPYKINFLGTVTLKP